MAIELGQLILRRSLRSAGGSRASCSSCRRTPVPGELLHVFAGERRLCALCVAGLPEGEREPLRRERVHLCERRVAVGPRAA